MENVYLIVDARLSYVLCVCVFVVVVVVVFFFWGGAGVN